MSNETKQPSLKGRKNLNVSDDTYDRLKEHGKFGESFDELINRLLDENEGFKASSSRSKK